MNDSEKKFYIVWVNDRNHQHLTIESSRVTVEVARCAGLLGWMEVWDSAPSEVAAAEFAASTYGSPVPCEITSVWHPLHQRKPTGHDDEVEAKAS